MLPCRGGGGRGGGGCCCGQLGLEKELGQRLDGVVQVLWQQMAQAPIVVGAGRCCRPGGQGGALHGPLRVDLATGGHIGGEGVCLPSKSVETSDISR